MVILQRLFILLLLALPLQSLAAIRVTLDRNPISINDTVQITIESDESIDGSPNISPLTEDFELISRSQRSSTQWVNGALSRSIQIIVTAQPKRQGSITIPALEWDDQKSQPVTLVVEAAPQAPGSPDGQALRDFYIEATLDKATPYVQEQVILTLKAYSNRGFTKGGFSSPQLPDSIVANPASNDDNIYETSINNVRYQVQERKLILYPQRSGTFDLGNIIFQGYFATGRRDIFGSQQLAPRRTSSAQLSLEVKPIPTAAPTPWLPAKQLSLSHYLSDGPYKTGEPITLTLSTIADGLMAEQLPEPQLELPDSLKAYPDQAEQDSNWDVDSVTAKRVDKIALIPTRPGKFTIPPVELRWWNTASDTIEVARIGPIEIEVTGAAAITHSGSTPPATPDSGSTPPTSSDAEAIVPSDQLTPPGKADLWLYVAIAATVLWLLTLAMLLRVWPRRAVAEQAGPTLAGDLKRKQLLCALPKADAAQAAQLLVHWAQSELDADITNPSQLKRYDHEKLNTAIDELNQSLYAPGEQAWQPESLIAALKRFQQQETDAISDKAKASPLPPLYPG